MFGLVVLRGTGAFLGDDCVVIVEGHAMLRRRRCRILLTLLPWHCRGGRSTERKQQREEEERKDLKQESGCSPADGRLQIDEPRDSDCLMDGLDFIRSQKSQSNQRITGILGVTRRSRGCLGRSFRFNFERSIFYIIILKYL